MDSIRSYLMGIIVAAVVSGIAVRLLGDKGTQGAMGKLIAGLFLTFTVIQPITDIRLDDFKEISNQFSADASIAVWEGEKMTRESLCQSIKAQSEAYILDKAEGMGLTLKVEVTVSNDDLPVPTAVTLSGAVSPWAKSKLSAILTEDLGIKKEGQTWI
ncbi:MAG: hypothetical protein IJV82_01090 [Oscillospiraceae bacterium]|nr:hypothetical protein [Oscillospiraceae bacterium]